MTREDVISNLAILRTWCAVNPNYGIGLSVVDCLKVVTWLDDAITLLKAQEPMLVKHTTSTIRCPKCNKQITSRGAIHKEIKYCWKCGQAVKWND